MRGKLIIFLLYLFVCVTGGTYAQKTNNFAADNPQVLFQQIQLALNQGDYPTAKKKMQPLLDFFEKNADMVEVDQQTTYIDEYVFFVGSYVDILTKMQEVELSWNILIHAEEFLTNKFSQIPYATRGIEMYFGVVASTVYDYDNALYHLSNAKRMHDNAGDNHPFYTLSIYYTLSAIYSVTKDFAFAKLIADEVDEYIQYEKYKEYFESKGVDYDPSSVELQSLMTLPAALYFTLGYKDKALERYESFFDRYGLYQLGYNWDQKRNEYAFALVAAENFSKSKEIFKITWEIGTDPARIEEALIGLTIDCIADSSDEAMGYLHQVNRSMLRNINSVLPQLSDLQKQNYWEKRLEDLAIINLTALGVFKETREMRELAYDIALYAKSMQDKQLHEVAKWQEVKKTLSKNEVAIEFVVCPSVSGDNIRLGALILRKNSKIPQYVDLCDISNMNLFTSAHTDTAKINQYYAEEDTLLYSLIWQKVVPLINECDVVYYSPISILSRLNLEVVSDGQRRMNQRFTLHQVSSTASIGSIKALKWQKRGDAVIYGGLIYDESVEEMQAAAKAYHIAPDEEMLAMRSIYQEVDDSRGAINILSGTLEEAQAIRDILVHNESNVTLFTEEQGNEESIKALGGHAPYILHIATHGFFLSSSYDQYQHRSITDRLDVLDNNQQYSMLYTGLLMAGASNAWLGREIPDGVEDGILTSYELSQIDLTGCRLAVLSACETGLGVPNSAFVNIGLGHALKLAGVQTVITSLWEVPDDATVILMKTFYEYISAGIDPSQALIKAQEVVRAKFPQPYYWAAFHLID